jgi:hypothetical protein
MKTLVSLIGEQTIPNVLFIKERTDCSRYIFISTERMNDKNLVSKTCKAGGIDYDILKRNYFAILSFKLHNFVL